MKTSHTKHAVFALSLFLTVSVALTSTVYATERSDSHYEKILKRIDFLNMDLKEKLKTNIHNNWNATTQSQQNDVLNILDSLDLLNVIYQQKKYMQISDPLAELATSLRQAEKISDITKHREDIRDLEHAVEVLNHSDQVRQTLKYNTLLDSKVYLHDIWEPVQKKLHKAKTIDDIMSFQTDINTMEKIIKRNSNIYENTHSPVFTLVDPNVKLTWNSFKTEMSQPGSMTEMAKITARYHKQVGQIDDKIISKWAAKIAGLKKDAKQQGNAQDLVRIDQNIKNLNMVKKIEQNSNPYDSDVQSKAILHNLSQNYLKIKSDLKEYDAYLDNKNQMVRKVTLLQDKANDKSNSEEMPEFDSKIKNTLETVSHIKDALDTNDFKYAQQLLDALDQEWFNFKRFYPEIRNYTPVYQQHDLSTVQKKHLYLQQISQIDRLVKSLDMNHTSANYQKYQKSIQESKASAMYGNFKASHEKNYGIIDFVNQNFLSQDPRIMMDVVYGDDTNMLIVKGAVYKHTLNSRDKVSFHLFDHNDEILDLNSRTSKHGEYRILSNIDIPSGLYVAQIRHGSAVESVIVSIQDENIQDMVFDRNEIAMMELASTFENLERFVNTFGDINSEKQVLKIQLLMDKIRADLTDGHSKQATKSIQKFKNNIKLYMPIQSPEIAIDVLVTENTLKITGDISKLVMYPEAIFLTIFDQHGRRVYEQITHDDKYGNINIEIPQNLLKGFLVVQVEYHDSLARDIVEIIR